MWWSSSGKISICDIYPSDTTPKLDYSFVRDKREVQLQFFYDQGEKS